jgi:hypothetical protein
MPIGSSLRSAFSPDVAPQHPDRRQSPRYDMSGGVFLLEDGVEPKKVGVVRDISLGGAYVASQDEVPTDQLLKLQFKIGADFEMSGHICRKDRNGFAVLFEEDAEAQSA